MNVYGDSHSGINLVKKPKLYTQTEHIDVDVAIRHVRELVEENLIDIQYIPTREISADTITEPSKSRHSEICRNKELTPKGGLSTKTSSGIRMKYHSYRVSWEVKTGICKTSC